MRLYADKATRVITEIAIESLPQCLLQSFILVVVIQQVGAGTAQPTIAALYDDASVMPKSITISTIAILKVRGGAPPRLGSAHLPSSQLASRPPQLSSPPPPSAHPIELIGTLSSPPCHPQTWLEIVQQSKEAGISVSTKAQQLWHVGAGLPLDALKKGSIVEWAYAGSEVLTSAEISPLLDALTKNTSLNRLNLAESGLDFDAAEANAAPLVQAMGRNGSAAALSGLQALVVSKVSGFAIPIGELRAGPERALAALERLNFFAAGAGNGPWHTDLMTCGDVLRTNGNRSVVTENEQETGEEIVRLLEDFKNGDDTPEERALWARRTKQFMAKGDLRRSQLQSLVGAECLRDVGFKAQELIAAGFRLFQLKDGLFTVNELREAGVTVADLSTTRYTPWEMREGGVAAAELRPLGYTPSSCRDGGYSAIEMRANASNGPSLGASFGLPGYIHAAFSSINSHCLPSQHLPLPTGFSRELTEP